MTCRIWIFIYVFLVLCLLLLWTNSPKQIRCVSKPTLQSWYWSTPTCLHVFLTLVVSRVAKQTLCLINMQFPKDEEQTESDTLSRLADTETHLQKKKTSAVTHRSSVDEQDNKNRYSERRLGSPDCFPPPTWTQHHNYGFNKLNKNKRTFDGSDPRFRLPPPESNQLLLLPKIHLQLSELNLANNLTDRQTERERDGEGREVHFLLDSAAE